MRNQQQRGGAFENVSPQNYMNQENIFMKSNS